MNEMFFVCASIVRESKPRNLSAHASKAGTKGIVLPLMMQALHHDGIHNSYQSMHTRGHMPAHFQLNLHAERKKKSFGITKSFFSLSFNVS